MKYLFSEKYKDKKVLTMKGEIVFDKEGYCKNPTDEQILLLNQSATIQILDDDPDDEKKSKDSASGKTDKSWFNKQK